MLLVFASSLFLSAQSLSSFGNNIHDSLPGQVVLDAEVYNGNLYLGGKFDLINGVSTSGFCKYDGVNTSAAWPCTALALELYNNVLAVAYIDGQGSSVGFWNETTLLSSGLNILPTTSLFDLKTFNGDLYLTGYFSANNTYYILAKYNGTSWTYHGEVSSLPKSGGLSLAVHNNMLHIGGAFDTINGSFFGTSIVAFNGTAFLPVNSVYGVATSIISNSTEIIEGIEQQAIGNPPFAKTLGSINSFIPFAGFATAEVGRVFNLGSLELYVAVSVRYDLDDEFHSGVLYLKQNQNYVQLCDSVYCSPPEFYLQMDRPRDLIRGVVFYNNQYIVYGGFKSTSVYAQQPQNLLAVIGSVLEVEENNRAQSAALYPNPTRDFLTFEVFDKTERYTIYNLQGVTLKTGTLSEQINVRTLHSGVYIFQRGSKDRFLRQRFIKLD